MRIEVLYPEICNLYGDAMNAEYLRRAIPEADFIKTTIKGKPAFTGGDVDLVYMGSMTESGQKIAAETLGKYRGEILDQIAAGKAFLVTGNAFELFGTHIENEDGSYIRTLGVFGLYSKRRMMHRYNSIYLGTFGDMEIVGFKSQFAHSYEAGNNGGAASYYPTSTDRAPMETPPELFTTIRGSGRRPGQTAEGVRINNFMATYVLGPLLILNPPFMRYMLALIGAGGGDLPYGQEAVAAYLARLREFHDPKTGEEYG